MNPYLDFSSIQGYTSKSQLARKITEKWFALEGYCPECGKNVFQDVDNKPVCDFNCTTCVQDFELKSKKGYFGKKVSSGAYSKMIERITSPEAPIFIFMSYVKYGENPHIYKIQNLFVVPSYYFKPELIEKRKPLAITARRAGWIGSNILLSEIPEEARISYIKNGEEVSKVEVMKAWKSVSKNHLP